MHDSDLVYMPSMNPCRASTIGGYSGVSMYTCALVGASSWSLIDTKWLRLTENNTESRQEQTQEQRRTFCVCPEMHFWTKHSSVTLYSYTKISDF